MLRHERDDRDRHEAQQQARPGETQHEQLEADQNEENRWAFLATTIFLSLFPLSIVGGTVAYLKRRVRQIDEEEALDYPLD